MAKLLHAILSGLVLSLAGKAGFAFAEDIPNSYSLHPPAISVPDGKPGETRRSLMQFYNWTLICDEILERKHMVCNVTQSVRDRNGRVVFSWSLAASDDGRPFMLLRALPDADKSAPVMLAMKTGGEPVKIAFIGCDQNICLARTPVGPVLAKAIDEGSVMKISYQMNDRKTIAFNTSFRGLKEAVASIR